jgi:hypothetical protein
MWVSVAVVESVQPLPVAELGRWEAVWPAVVGKFGCFDNIEVGFTGHKLLTALAPGWWAGAIDSWSPCVEDLSRRCGDSHARSNNVPPEWSVKA